MSGRAGMRLAAAVLLAVVAATASGCASADHSWRGEFDARLEGVSGSLEEALAASHPGTSEREIFETFIPLGRTTEFKSELVKELNPPEGCEQVQERGEHGVGRIPAFAYGVPKNLTAYLERHLPSILKREIAQLREIEREAESCA